MGVLAEIARSLARDLSRGCAVTDQPVVQHGAAHDAPCFVTALVALLLE